MKILLVSNRFPPKVVGGAEITAATIATGLSNRNHHVYCVTLSDNLGTGRPSRTDNGRVIILEVPNFNIYNQFDKRERGALAKLFFACLDNFNIAASFFSFLILRRVRPDIILCHNIKGIGPAFWIAAKLARVPLVQVVHDYWLACPRATMYNEQRRCEVQCISCKLLSAPKRALSHRLVSDFVAVSNFVRIRMKSLGYFGEKSGNVVYNARKLFDPSNTKWSRRLVSSPYKIGYIGRIEPEKGIEYIFSSVNLLPFPVELHIAGRDSNGTLEQVRKKFPNVLVVIRGFVSPAEFYPSVDVVVVPSDWDEPLGNVAFEAWEFSIPSIVSSRGGLPEVVGDRKSSVFDPDDPLSLPALLTDLFQSQESYDLRSQNAFSRRSKFLVNEQIDQYEKILMDSIKMYEDT